MIDSAQKNSTISWLQNKLHKREHGIVFNHVGFSCFNLIQDFVEANDHRFKTPAIYYEAIPQESATEFIATLKEEIIAKVGHPYLNLDTPLSEIVANTGLKMVIIDRSHLHSLRTLNELLESFVACNVCLLLVGSHRKLKIAQFLSHPEVSQWSRLTIERETKSLPKTC